MSTIRLRRTLPAFTLLAALLVTPVVANARPNRPHRDSRPAAAASTSFLGDVWHRLTGLWGASGGSIDPWGGQAQPPSGTHPSGTGSPAGDSGMSIDPNG
jgi:hypothetical protein